MGDAKYADRILYLVTFPDDKANFYVELNDKLEPLFESKKIDVQKIVSCPDFKLNKIYCDVYIKSDDDNKLVKAKITKLFPSNWDGRKNFFNLLEEQKTNIEVGGKKKRRRKTRRNKSKKSKKGKKSRKNKKN